MIVLIMAQLEKEDAYNNLQMNTSGILWLLLLKYRVAKCFRSLMSVFESAALLS